MAGLYHIHTERERERERERGDTRGKRGKGGDTEREGRGAQQAQKGSHHAHILPCMHTSAPSRKGSHSGAIPQTVPFVTIDWVASGLIRGGGQKRYANPKDSRVGPTMGACKIAPINPVFQN